MLFMPRHSALWAALCLYTICNQPSFFCTALTISQRKELNECMSPELAWRDPSPMQEPSYGEACRAIAKDRMRRQATPI